MAPNANVTFYPVRSGQTLNFVDTVRRDGWQSESWTERGDKDEYLADFQGWHDSILAIIRSIDCLYKWGLASRTHPPPPRWVPRKARHPLRSLTGKGLGAVHGGLHAD